MTVRVWLVLAALLSGQATAYVRAYAVDPVKAEWSGKVRGDENHPVSQVVTCCFDSLKYVELFAGAYGNGGGYRVTVLELPGSQPVAQSQFQQGGDHRWVRMDDWGKRGTLPIFPHHTDIDSSPVAAL